LQKGELVLIPNVVEHTARGERVFDIYSRLLGHRIVFLSKPIDFEVADLIVAQLLHLASDDGEEPISLYINSPGGETSSMMAIYDTMQHVGPQVTTTCIGLAASAAAVILASGAPGSRFVLPHSRVLIHQPHLSGSLEGPATDIEIHAREIIRQKEEMIAILAAHTGQTEATIARDSDRDHWLTAEEAVAYGLADAVMPPTRVSPGAGRGHT
jgi:ATP-dependent Clp protease protease subunit